MTSLLKHKRVGFSLDLGKSFKPLLCLSFPLCKMEVLLVLLTDTCEALGDPLLEHSGAEQIAMEA